MKGSIRLLCFRYLFWGHNFGAFQKFKNSLTSLEIPQLVCKKYLEICCLNVPDNPKSMLLPDLSCPWQLSPFLLADLTKAPSTYRTELIFSLVFPLYGLVSQYLLNRKDLTHVYMSVCHNVDIAEFWISEEQTLTYMQIPHLIVGREATVTI